ncbi:MAG: hypothetical protein AAFY47_09495 [Pseudomonadota bacterium]
MKTLYAIAVALGSAIAIPALAQDEPDDAAPLTQEVRINTEAGEILVQYTGSTKIIGRTIGANRVVTRADPTRCAYAVDLVVERVATLGDETQAMREMTTPNVIRGIVPQRCSTSPSETEIDRQIERSQREFDRAFDRIIERDRDDVIAEIDDQLASDEEE